MNLEELARRIMAEHFPVLRPGDGDYQPILDAVLDGMTRVHKRVEELIAQNLVTNPTHNDGIDQLLEKTP